MPVHERPLRRVFRFLASLKLAVILLLVLATVLATATILEAQHGTAYARWYVYESLGFVGLLALLGVNIFCAAAIRFPWKRHQTGFVITHCGLLVLLGGSMQSFLGGVEGRVSLVEGESKDKMLLGGRSQVTAFWVGRPDEAPYEFTFDAGPVDWPAGRTLEVGEIDGVRLRVLGFFRHPEAVEEWVRDEAELGGPVVKFRLTGQDGAKLSENWLVDQQFGDAVFLGPLRLQLERAVTDRMLDDFLKPPEGLGEKGLLAMYYGNVVEHVSLDQQVGERVALGDSGVAVEIAEYLPNAAPDKLGQFVSKGEQPKNPMVELRVHLPDEEKPLRQIAFAKDALLNLDGVYPRLCPVKFRFHHPAIQPATAFELLQTSDGRLHGRVCSAGTVTSQGEIKPGSSLTLPGGFRLEIVDYLPHGRHKLTFVAGKANRKAKDKSEPAALVELHVQGRYDKSGDRTHQFWLRRSDSVHGRQTFTTPAGAMALHFEQAQVPLGFSLKLLDFRREKNPGQAGNAAFSSRVQVVDRRNGIDREHTISMNEPLTQGRYTFYQSSFDQGGHGKEVSSFNVAYDPGRFAKYAGSLMICLGISLMFFMRAYFVRRRVPEEPTSEPRIISAVMPMERAG